jgi:hypothetical protein
MDRPPISLARAAADLGEVAQHVVQHAAMFDVFDLDGGIDPALERDLLRRAIGVGDRAGHFLQRLDRVETRDRDRLVALQARATCACRRR